MHFFKFFCPNSEINTYNIITVHKQYIISKRVVQNQLIDNNKSKRRNENQTGRKTKQID